MSKFDWSNWHKKLSTLVAGLATSVGLMATALVGYYTQLPPEQQANWPWWLVPALTLAPTLIAALGPFAVAFRQAFLESPDTDNDYA